MTAKDWLMKAKSEHFAIGAFNVGNLETLKAVAHAAANQKSPVIIESSPGETAWFGAENIVSLAKNFSKMYQVPILVNLDHACEAASCQQAINLGFDLVHYDGSQLPYQQNVINSQPIVQLAHKEGLLVEGEIDHIQGSSEMHSGSAAQEAAKGAFTDPEQAKLFVQATGIDIFASFFGNVHGVFLGNDEHLSLDLLARIAQTLPDTFLSLHGGSGIPDEEIRQAIGLGIVKVNVNTDIRQVFRKTLEKALEEQPDEYAPYKFMANVVEAVSVVVEQKIALFGSAGKM